MFLNKTTIKIIMKVEEVERMKEVTISITIDEEEMQTLKDNGYIDSNDSDDVYNAIHWILSDLKKSS